MTRSLAMMLVICAAWGCGPDKPSYPAAQLEGNVTVDGKPVPQGQIQFMPQETGRLPVTSAAIVDGRYVAMDVPQGKVRVLLTGTKETGKMIKEYSSSRPEVINVIPDKYRAGIALDVTGDNRNQNFDLKSH